MTGNYTENIQKKATGIQLHKNISIKSWFFGCV